LSSGGRRQTKQELVVQVAARVLLDSPPQPDGSRTASAAFWEAVVKGLNLPLTR
jgi:hypothetical protein